MYALCSIIISHFFSAEWVVDQIRYKDVIWMCGSFVACDRVSAMDTSHLQDFWEDILWLNTRWRKIDSKKSFIPFDVPLFGGVAKYWRLLFLYFQCKIDVFAMWSDWCQRIRTLEFTVGRFSSCFRSLLLVYRALCRLHLVTKCGGFPITSDTMWHGAVGLTQDS